MCLTCVISYKLPWHMEYSLFSETPGLLVYCRKERMKCLLLQTNLKNVRCPLNLVKQTVLQCMKDERVKSLRINTCEYLCLQIITDYKRRMIKACRG